MPHVRRWNPDSKHAEGRRKAKNWRAKRKKARKRAKQSRRKNR